MNTLDLSILFGIQESSPCVFAGCHQTPSGDWTVEYGVVNTGKSLEEAKIAALKMLMHELSKETRLLQPPCQTPPSPIL